ncbi:MAG: C39 family peptidase [bacterium]
MERKKIKILQYFYYSIAILATISAVIIYYLFFIKTNNLSLTASKYLYSLNKNGYIFKKKQTEILPNPILDKTAPENKAKNNSSIFAQANRSDSASFTMDKSGENNSILLTIPFTSQAPTADWKDPRQQDSCEEASSLMVIKWIKGEKLTPQEAEIKLAAISEWEKKEYKNFRDTSSKDTMERIIKRYFKYDNAELKQNINLEILKKELLNGNAIIAPMDGQKLKNPYYTAPGPERHMLVIRGYDADKKEFITNDPGTRRGEEYRYNEYHFFSAIRDYPTGYHEPIEKIEKNIIVVKPK